MHTLKTDSVSTNKGNGILGLNSITTNKLQSSKKTKGTELSKVDSPEKGNTSSQLKTLLAWQALKFESTPKSMLWYIIVFVILVSLVAIGLFSDNFPLAILAILTGLILYLFEKKESQSFKFGITTEGVFAQDRIYKFSSLDNFWIFYKPNGKKELSLKSKKALIPYIQIPLGNVDPSALRELLLDFIPEVEHEEIILDSLEQLL